MSQEDLGEEWRRRIRSALCDAHFDAWKLLVGLDYVIERIRS